MEEGNGMSDARNTMFLDLGLKNEGLGLKN